MSKLEQLIQELCPDGVEYKKLEELCGTITTGKLNANAMDENGRYPFFTCDSNPFKINTYAFDTEAILISGNGSQVGHINYYKGKFNAYQRTYVLCDFNAVNTKFLLHYLKWKLKEYILVYCKKGSVPYITLPMLQSFKVPVPPLEVQCEIVRILDDFTLLIAELTAELTARKNQYTYFEELLMNNEAEVVKLEEICNICAGGTPTKTKSEYWEGGTIKWLGSTVCKNKKTVDEITGYITKLGLEKSSAKLLNEKTTLIAMVGATIGKVAFLDFEATTNQNVACLYPKDINKLDPNYLYYACKNLYIKFIEFANGKFAMASLGFIKSLEIPLPSIEEQLKISSKLDKLDKLCNDISEGLPAEIESRKKQYEYYRDKLLTFKEKQV